MTCASNIEPGVAISVSRKGKKRLKKQFFKVTASQFLKDKFLFNDQTFGYATGPI